MCMKAAPSVLRSKVALALTFVVVLLGGSVISAQSGPPPIPPPPNGPIPKAVMLYAGPVPGALGTVHARLLLTFFFFLLDEAAAGRVDAGKGEEKPANSRAGPFAGQG